VASLRAREPRLSGKSCNGATVILANLVDLLDLLRLCKFNQGDSNRSKNENPSGTEHLY